LCSVLGGQGGRLFLELRDKLSLCYSVSAFSVEGLHPGYFAVYMGTAQEKLEQAEAGLRRELVKCVEAEISDDELRRAQRYLVGTHAVGLQRASARAGTMSLNALYGLGHDLDRRYPAMIEAVTPASVRSVAREVLRFDRVVRSVVEVGPEES
jgi:zinc protease